MSDRIGVLLMAYGSPNDPEDLPGYLADIRRGRPTSRAIVEELAHNYARIGRASPLLALTQRQREALAAALEQADPKRFQVYLGMRHWAPWIEETVGQMIDDGVTRAVSLVLAPHYSSFSVAAYQGRIASGLSMYRALIDFAHVNSYHDAPTLIAALAARVSEGIARWPAAERDAVHIVFSAHSLPARVLQNGDPYDAQVRETAALVAARAGLSSAQWSWSYQSAGRTPEAWLGPALPDHLAALASRGVTRVVSVPVGFVSDHVEVLYDIDIAGQEVATALGMKLERPPALNDDPTFIAGLAALVRERAARAGYLD